KAHLGIVIAKLCPTSEAQLARQKWMRSGCVCDLVVATLLQELDCSTQWLAPFGTHRVHVKPCERRAIHGNHARLVSQRGEHVDGDGFESRLYEAGVKFGKSAQHLQRVLVIGVGDLQHTVARLSEP